jgi:hypothetical protein
MSSEMWERSFDEIENLLCSVVSQDDLDESSQQIHK